jgi:hypothetical protein
MRKSSRSAPILGLGFCIVVLLGILASGLPLQAEAPEAAASPALADFLATLAPEAPPAPTLLAGCTLDECLDRCNCPPNCVGVCVANTNHCICGCRTTTQPIAKCLPL